MGAGGAVSACGLWLSEGRTCRRPADRVFEAPKSGHSGASPPHRSLCFGPLSLFGEEGNLFPRGGRRRWERGRMVGADGSWFSEGKTG